MCGMCWMSDAMEILLLSFLLPEMKRVFDISDFVESLLGAVVFAGMLFGAYTWGFVADRWGRRLSLLLLLILTCIFGIASAFAPNIWFLLVVRCLVGFGVGGSVVPFSLFTEYLPIRGRGFFLLIIEAFWTVGAVGESGLAWILLPEDSLANQLTGGNGWRVLVFVSALPFIIVLAMIPLLPESLRFYVVKNKSEKIEAIFKRMSWYNRKPMPEGELVLNQRSLIDDDEDDPEIQKKNESTVLQFFKGKMLAMSLIIWFLWFSGGLSYYGIVISTPSFFSRSDSPHDLYLSTFIASLAELPGLLVATLLINVIGRKKTQAITFAAAGIPLLLLLAPIPMWALTIAAVVSRAGIMGSTCTLWVYSSEAFPTSLRSLGMGISSSMSRVAGFITPFIAKMLMSVNPTIPISIYSVVCLAAAGASLLLPIETKGLVLRDTVSDLEGVEETKQSLLGHTAATDDNVSTESMSNTGDIYEEDNHGLYQSISSAMSIDGDE